MVLDGGEACCGTLDLEEELLEVFAMFLVFCVLFTQLLSDLEAERQDAHDEARYREGVCHFVV